MEHWLLGLPSSEMRRKGPSIVVVSFLFLLLLLGVVVVVFGAGLICMINSILLL